MNLFDHFSNEIAAQAYLEMKVWPDGPHCPHCGETQKLGRLNGVSTAAGSFKCYSCRRRFNLRHGTVFENSHVPLHIWLRAIYLLAASEQHWGAQRLSRGLGVSIRTAWHLKIKILQAVSDACGDDAVNHSLYEPSQYYAIAVDAKPTCTVRHEADTDNLVVDVGQDLRIDLRFKMFREAAAQLLIPDAERKFENLMQSVIGFSTYSGQAGLQDHTEVQLMLWGPQG